MPATGIFEGETFALDLNRGQLPIMDNDDDDDPNITIGDVTISMDRRSDANTPVFDPLHEQPGHR